MPSECKTCFDEYEAGELVENGNCRRCDEKDQFSRFAAPVGLTRFPHPSGERYVYRVGGEFEGKKSECTDLIDELWNAIVRLGCGSPELLIGVK